MQITFSHITLHNFMSFEDASIQLDHNGFVTVVGENNNVVDNAYSNGAGKSSIWEGICWSLTGSTIRGTKDVQRYGSDTCYVEIEFDCNGVNYKIKRTKTPSNLFLYVNDENKSGKGIKDTEKLLAQYFPDLTESLINSVIILGQGLPQRFTNNTPAGRKDVLEKLSQSDYMIADLKTRIDTRSNELSKSIRTCEDKGIELSTLIRTLTSQISSAQSSLEREESCDIETEQAEISKIEKDLETNDKARSEWQELQCTYEKSYNEVTNQLISLAETAAREKSLVNEQFSEKILSLNSKISETSTEIRTTTSELIKKQNITDVCPTCGQKLPNVIKPDTTELEIRLDKLRVELEEYKSELNTVQMEKSSKLADVDKSTMSSKKELSDKKNDIGSNLNDVKAKINSLAGSDRVLTSRLNSLKQQLINHDNTITMYREQIATAEESKKKNEQSLLYNNTECDRLKDHMAIINKFSTAVKRDFRGYLLQNVISYINECAKGYCETLFNTDKLNFELDGNNIAISYNGKEYENLSGGEKQKIDLCIQFSLRDMLCQFLNFSCNILVLDEITDNLDELGCDKVIELISTNLTDINSVYIISHRTDLSIPSDKQLIITKDNQGISKCSMR